MSRIIVASVVLIVLAFTGASPAAERVTASEMQSLRGGTWFTDDDCENLPTAGCPVTNGCAPGTPGGAPCSICTAAPNRGCVTSPALAPDVYPCRSMTLLPNGTYTPMTTACGASNGKCAGAGGCMGASGVTGAPGCGSHPDCAD
jgi:hypothetical protein